MAASSSDVWDGAGPGTNLEPGKPAHQCYACKARYSLFGCLASMYHPEFKEFHRFQSPTLTKALDKKYQRPFQNVGTDKDGNKLTVELICYKCAGSNIHQNERHFVKTKDDGTSRLTADWLRKMKSSKFEPSQKKENRMVDRACEVLIKKRKRCEEEGEGPDIAEVVKTLRANEDVRKASDWVSHLGHAPVYLLYGHKECNRKDLERWQPQIYENKEFASEEKLGIYPLRSGSFYRLASPTATLGHDKDGAGTRFATWHCGACLGKWTHRDDSGYRLMVMADGNEKEWDKAFAAYLGDGVSQLGLTLLV